MTFDLLFHEKTKDVIQSSFSFSLFVSFYSYSPLVCISSFILHPYIFVGLNEIAVSSLDEEVIVPLKHCLARPDISAASLFVFRNLLGEALMTCGEWMSERKSASSLDILEHYLQAAGRLYPHNNCLLHNDIICTC